MRLRRIVTNEEEHAAIFNLFDVTLAAVTGLSFTHDVKGRFSSSNIRE